MIKPLLIFILVIVAFEGPSQDISSSIQDQYQPFPQTIKSILKDSLIYDSENLFINSRQSEFSTTYYKNGIIFVSDRENSKAKQPVYNWDNTSFFKLYYVERMGFKSFSKPKLFKELDYKLHEGPLVFYDNENKLIITRNISTKVRGKKEIITIGLFKGEFSASKNKWSELEGMPFNSDRYSVGQPAITEDGSTIYFMSNMPGGFGGTDIYKSHRTEHGWTKPENLGGLVNTEEDELFPFYHSKAGLFFSSRGHGALGGLDVFQINLELDSVVTRLGSPINSPSDDYAYILSPDGSYGYFSSNRPGGWGKDDIYSFWLNKPRIHVLVVDNKTDEVLSNVNGHLNSEDEKIEGEYLSNDEGIMAIDLDAHYDYNLILNKPGYLPHQIHIDMDVAFTEGLFYRVKLSRDDKEELANDSLKFTINENELLASKATDTYTSKAESTDYNPHLPKNDANELLKESITNEKIKFNKTESVQPAVTQGQSTNISKQFSGNEDIKALSINNVHYNFDQSTIGPDSKKELDKVIILLNNHPELKVYLSGHTDSRGSKTYNYSLGNRRAMAAKSYLLSKGIKPDRIITASFGEDKILNECGDNIDCLEEQHQVNRRTEIKFIVE